MTTKKELSDEEKAAQAAAAQAAADADGNPDPDAENETSADEMDDLRQALHDADTEIARLTAENEKLTENLAAANRKAGVKIAKGGKKTFVLTRAITGPDGPLEAGDEIELDAEQAKYYRDNGLIE